MSRIFKKKFLGRGGQSNVYLIDYQGKPAVLKELINPTNIKGAENEINSLVRISNKPHCHPSIVCIYDYKIQKNTYRSNNNNLPSTYIIEEYIPGNDLNFINNQYNFTEEEILYILEQLAKTIEYLHSRNIVHRDIKLENIIITPDNKIKLIDFGLSCVSSLCVDNFVGTAHYLSPELLRYNAMKESLDFHPDEDILLEMYKTTDIWALGIVAYNLANHMMPYKSRDVQSLYEEILTRILLYQKVHITK